MKIHNNGSGTGRRVCLNCGSRSKSKFCPECGQSMDTHRFTAADFSKNTFRSLLRLSDTFFHTCKLLMSRPWVVIKDYVYGRRICYTNPVSLLILLSFYTVLAMNILHYDTDDLVEVSVDLNPESSGYALFQLFKDSISFQWILLALPISLAVRRVYSKSIKDRFNYVEIVVATLYFCCTSLIYSIVLIPVWFINHEVSDLINLAVVVILGVISVVKAFPQRNLLITVLRLFKMLLYAFVLWILIAVAFFLIIDYLDRIVA